MLITKEVEINLNGGTVGYWEELGYKIPRKINSKGIFVVPKGTNITIKTSDLSNKSKITVSVKCDGCGIILNNVRWADYTKCRKEDGKYYCRECGKKLSGVSKTREILLNKSKSFEQWCVENNRQDILDRWDYELNKFKPNEITYGTNKRYWFKCPRGLHNSELKVLSSLTTGEQEGSMFCNKCGSLAQWGIDNLGEDFLEKYWDYESNIGVNPWKIEYGSKNKIYIKCQNKEYHKPYILNCNAFTRGNRCPYCTNRNGKVHVLDSLGSLHQSILPLWSEKNKKSPYKYSPNANRKVWWKCPDGKHEDYLRSISSSVQCNFRCPSCSFSKGEKGIEYCLIKNQIKYIPQKEFEGLVGLKGGKLSYDFYLDKLNVLIEFQGEFHDGSGNSSRIQSKQALEKQKEHDRRKKQYAESHGIKLLEIWYWDFENIEIILNQELNIPPIQEAI